jgi:hypothetical protein
MPEIFADDIRSVQVVCRGCGTPLELADSGIEAFGSADSVLCLECLVLGSPREAEPAARAVPLAERVVLIDEVVATFAARLRAVLVRSIKPDLSWDGARGFESWGDPSDALVAAHAPGIWYALRRAGATPRRG